MYWSSATTRNALAAYSHELSETVSNILVEKPSRNDAWSRVAHDKSTSIHRSQFPTPAGNIVKNLHGAPFFDRTAAEQGNKSCKLSVPHFDLACCVLRRNHNERQPFRQDGIAEERDRADASQRLLIRCLPVQELPAGCGP